METCAERASGLELLQALSLFLSQCLSAKAENAIIRNNQLPEWQQKSLSRLSDPYTADRVPNSEKLRGKWRFLRNAEEDDVSEHCGIADLGSSVYLQFLWLKLVPFVRRTSGEVECREHLGGILRYYYRAAA